MLTILFRSGGGAPVVETPIDYAVFTFQPGSALFTFQPYSAVLTFSRT